MKNAIAYILILALPLAAQAGDSPRIQTSKNQPGVLQLGETASAALKAAHPDFIPFTAKDFTPSVQDMFVETPNESPMAITGDFNSDKITDVIVMGRSQKEQLVIALISDAKGFTATVIERQPLIEPEKSHYPPISEDNSVSDESEADILREKGLFRYLTLLPKGERLGGKKSKRLTADGLQIENFGSDGQVFLMQNGRFVQYKGP